MSEDMPNDPPAAATEETSPPDAGSAAPTPAARPDIALNWLLDPIAPDAPCGPDPEQNRDLGVQAYIAAAQMRLPRKFVNIDSMTQEVTLFDASGIDLPEERERAFEVLRRVRDLRVLTTLARFEAVCFNFAGFADCVEAAAALIAAWPKAVHPQKDDGGETLRKPLALLDNPATVRNPLYYVPLNGKSGVHYRNYMKAEKGDHPDGIDAEAFVGRLGHSGGAKKRQALYADLLRVVAALTELKGAFRAATGAELDDSLKGVGTQLEQMLDLMRHADPDLAGPDTAGDAADAAETDADPVDGAAERDDARPEPAARPAPAQPAIAIHSREHAAAALEAVEIYLSQNEPSSLSLVLVAQARMLIGKPLTEAMATLAQNQTGQAVVRFEDDLPFQLNWEQLRRLTEQAMQNKPKPAPAPDAPPAEPVTFPALENRDGIAPVLRGVEAYLKKSEISSPVPLLLSKARSFLSKDFTQVFKELTKRNG